MAGEWQPLLRMIEELAKQIPANKQDDITAAALSELVEGFTSSPGLARRVIREMLRASPMDFGAAALRVLQAGRTSPGQEYLTGLILEHDLLVNLFAHSSVLPIQTAIAWARHLLVIDPQFDSKLLRLIITEDGSLTELDRSTMDRIFEIIGAISDVSRLTPKLIQLMRHKDNHVRSKVALLLSSGHHNVEWLAYQMKSSDARIRSNAIQGLLNTNPSESELEVVRKALEDSHHRVVSTALLVLYKNRERNSADMLREMTSHSDELHRTAAAWAMGQTDDKGFLEVLQKMARSDVGNAKRMAFKSSVQLRKGQPAKNNGAEENGSNGTL